MHIPQFLKEQKKHSIQILNQSRTSQQQSRWPNQAPLSKNHITSEEHEKSAKVNTEVQEFSATKYNNEKVNVR